MLIDSALTLAAGLLAAGSNNKTKSLAIVVFVSFAMLQVYSDIFLKILQMTKEPVVYLAYSTIQITAMVAFIKLKAGWQLKTTNTLILLVNSLMIFNYIIVANFGRVGFSLHAAYNPIVWSLMLTQLLYLLWIEKDVVISIRKQVYFLYINSPIASLVGDLRSRWNIFRGYK